MLSFLLLQFVACSHVGPSRGFAVILLTFSSSRFNLPTVRRVCHLHSRETKKLKTSKKKTSGISTRLLRSTVSTEFKTEQDWVWFQNRVSRDGLNSVSTVLSLNCRQASRPLSLGQVSLLVVALHCCKNNAINSTCLVLRVDPFSLDHAHSCRGITPLDLLPC